MVEKKNGGLIWIKENEKVDAIMPDKNVGLIKSGKTNRSHTDNIVDAAVRTSELALELSC